LRVRREEVSSGALFLERPPSISDGEGIPAATLWRDHQVDQERDLPAGLVRFFLDKASQIY
jgi:hypothetical protein